MYNPKSNLQEKENPCILKDDFFLKNRPNHFPINSTSIIRNKLSLPSIEINKIRPALVHSVS